MQTFPTHLYRPKIKNNDEETKKKQIETKRLEKIEKRNPKGSHKHQKEMHQFKHIQNVNLIKSTNSTAAIIHKRIV